MLERPPAAAAARARAGDGRRSSPTCTASTASTCAPASPSRRSSRRRHDDVGAVLLADGTGSRPTSSSSASARRPTSSLAEAAGLDVDNGVARRRQRLRTSDPDVFAAGDVANAEHPVLGRQVRVEHWANALNQPAPRPRGDARRGRRLRPAAVLLHRPVRPRHGVRRARRPAARRGGGARRRRAGVRRVLAPRRAGHRGDDRQRLGRARRRQGPHPVRQRASTRHASPTRACPWPTWPRRDDLGRTGRAGRPAPRRRHGHPPAGPRSRGRGSRRLGMPRTRTQSAPRTASTPRPGRPS